MLRNKFENSLISKYIVFMKTTDAVSLISKIREQVNRFIVAEMAEQGVEGIATSHGDIIYTLAGKPRMTMAEVSRSIRKDKSTVTALVDKLIRLELVQKEKDATDTRITFVSLTPKGEALKPVFEEISHKLMDSFYTGFSVEEKKELLRLLMKVHHNF